MYSLFAFSIHYLTLPTGRYVCLLGLASNQHSQAELLLNELHHVIFSWSSTMFTKQNPAAKSEKTMICIVVPRQFGSNSAAGSGRRGCVVVQISTSSCRTSEIVKSDVGNQYWNGRTTGHYNGKSHLAWDLVFTILLSRRPHGPMQNLAFWKQELNPP